MPSLCYQLTELSLESDTSAHSDTEVTSDPRVGSGHQAQPERPGIAAHRDWFREHHMTQSEPVTCDLKILKREALLPISLGAVKMMQHDVLLLI